MTTNSYFRSSFTSATKDQVLKENLIIEAIQIYGVDMKYLPRTYVNFDSLFGEDQSSAFNAAHDIEMYVRSVDGFGGDGHFLTKFGLEIRDEVILEASIKRFGETVTTADPTIVRPREGDLLKLPAEVDHRERLWEISYVDEDYINHQLGKVHTYEIRCKVFEMAGETFNTGDNTIDSYEDDYQLTQTYTLDTGTGTFTVGETVTQTNGYTGTVVSLTGNDLEVSDIIGKVDVTLNITGSTSGADWAILEVETTVGQATLEDNMLIQDEDDAIIDFTISNPFSE